MTGDCQTNIEGRDIRPEPGLKQSAWRAIPVVKGGKDGAEGSTVVHRWVSTCIVAEELMTSGRPTDDVYNLMKYNPHNIPLV